MANVENADSPGFVMDGEIDFVAAISLSVKQQTNLLLKIL